MAPGNANMKTLRTNAIIVVLGLLLLFLLTSCTALRPKPSIVERIDAARILARNSVKTWTNETGGTSCEMSGEGIDAYVKLLEDKSLPLSDRLLVAESAGANLDYLSSGRAEMEYALAIFYFGEMRDYEQAAFFANLCITTAGEQFVLVRWQLTKIRFASLCKLERYREAKDLLELTQNEGIVTLDNPAVTDTLAQWQKVVDAKLAKESPKQTINQGAAKPIH